MSDDVPGAFPQHVFLVFVPSIIPSVWRVSTSSTTPQGTPGALFKHYSVALSGPKMEGVTGCPAMFSTNCPFSCWTLTVQPDIRVGAKPVHMNLNLQRKHILAQFLIYTK